MIARRISIAALAALLALPAQAQVPENVAEIGIVPGWRDSDGRHVAGLSIRLAHGWKTYWRAPGEGGIPPVFNWSGSSNITGVDIHYPVPEVFHQNGLRSIGYKDSVLFPLLIDTQDASGPIRLQGEIEIGVCEEICIPITFRVAAELMPEKQHSGPLAAALNDRPAAGSALRCEISPIADGLRVGVETDMAPMGGEEVAIVEAGESGLWISEALVSRSGATLRAEVEMVPPNAKPFALARSDVRLTILGGGQAVESLGCD
jgi:DsbC/DsbD-like thiol-disulfide interchange protein